MAHLPPVLMDERRGARLPVELGSWRLHQETELTGAADDERDAMQLIEAYGFCCFRAKATA